MNNLLLSTQQHIKITSGAQSWLQKVQKSKFAQAFPNQGLPFLTSNNDNTVLYLMCTY